MNKKLDSESVQGDNGKDKNKDIWRQGKYKFPR